MKNYLLKNILSAFLLICLFLPIIASAKCSNGLELCYPTIPGAPPGAGTLTNKTELHQLIAWLYYFIIYISGLAAFVMLVWAGFVWMTSAGNPGRIGDAKDRATDAVLGLIIIFASYLIIQIINPELLVLKLPKL